MDFTAMKIGDLYRIVKKKGKIDIEPREKKLNQDYEQFFRDYEEAKRNLARRFNLKR